MEKENKKDNKKETEKKASTKLGNAYKVLIRPLVTEKNSNQANLGKYSFEVGVNANKIEIKNAINEVYKVKPTSVNIINVLGKKVRRGRHIGRRKDWKKAIVTLKKGETLPIYNV